MAFDKKEYARQYHLKNKDKINLKARERPGNKEKHHQYYLDHKEEFSRKAKERYLKNSEKIKDRVHKRYAEKHDEILEQQAEYYQENKEKIFENNRNWVSNNKDKVKIIKARYRESHRDKLRKDSLEYANTHREQGLVNKRKWRARNPDKLKEEKLKARFGITLDQFNELKKQQNNCCGICGEAFDKIPNSAKCACVDHDHKVKKIRGLLCHTCNSGIGCLRDDPVLMEKAVLWIKNSGPLYKEKVAIHMNVPKSRQYAIKHRFGLTVNQYKKLFVVQKNKCGICDSELGKRANIDHDHKTQKIRGMLCSTCNASLGLLKEDIEIIKKAINWVKGDSNANS